MDICHSGIKPINYHFLNLICFIMCIGHFYKPTNLSTQKNKDKVMQGSQGLTERMTLH